MVKNFKILDLAMAKFEKVDIAFTMLGQQITLFLFGFAATIYKQLEPHVIKPFAELLCKFLCILLLY